MGRRTHFNSRPHEEVDALRIFRLQIQVHFNSRPHEEVDSQSSALPLHPNISTHDLTKRSTATDVMDSYSVSIFQLTTSRRGRPGQQNTVAFVYTFQLTTSRRGRHLTVSSSLNFYKHFNSRPHEEVDSCPFTHINRILVFQLTTSRRGRLLLSGQFHGPINFNSRPHEEVDGKQLAIVGRDTRISTHDLTKRSTDVQHIFSIMQNFNSRPHEEVDRCCRTPLKPCLYFNSRPHEEVDGNFYAKSFPFQITFCAYCI